MRSPGARSWETSGPPGPGGAGSGVPGTRLLQVAGKAGLAWDGKHKRSIKGERGTGGRGLGKGGRGRGTGEREMDGGGEGKTGIDEEREEDKWRRQRERGK